MNVFKLLLLLFFIMSLFGCIGNSTYTSINFSSFEVEKSYYVQVLIYNTENDFVNNPIRQINLDSISSDINKELWVNLYYDVKPQERVKVIINDTLIYDIKNMKTNNDEIVSMTVNNHHLENDSGLVIPMEIGIVKKNIMKCN